MFLFRFPERVRILLAPIIQAEMQNAAKDQKLAIDGALMAVQVAHSFELFSSKHFLKYFVNL